MILKFIKIVLGLDDGTTTQQDVQVSESVKCVCDVKLVSTTQVSETLQEKHLKDPPPKPKPKPKPTPEAETPTAGDKPNTVPPQ